MTAARPLTLFLADDDEDDRMLFEDALQRTGRQARLLMGEGGENLLDELAALPRMPDAVFVDLNMPRRNGLECLDLLRQLPPGTRPKLVVISTSNAPLIIEKTRQRGADYYIRKPESFPEFVRVLSLCLQKIVSPPGPDGTFLLNELPERA